MKLDIINIMGQKIATLVNGSLAAGEHHMLWDGKDDNDSHVASGVYLYRLTAGNFVETKKMILLK